MDFSFTEEQAAIRDVARQLFGKLAPKERLEEVERQDVRFDTGLWRELAAADLLGVSLPEAVGGTGAGFVELCALLAELGRAVAPVPLYPTLVLGADTMSRHGSPDLQRRFLPGVVDGSRVLTAAVSEPGRSIGSRPTTTATRDGGSWRLEGVKDLVPAAQLSGHLLVPAVTDAGEVGIFVVDGAAGGVALRPVTTTNGEPHADVELDHCVVDADDVVVIDDGAAFALLVDRAVIGLCAVELGVGESALHLAAQYTTEREQFGRPIGSFQAVQQRMADAFIDVEAMRWTTYNAAWLVDVGRPASGAAAIAKFWAGEAGARVAATTQQVHGGIGIDVSYPLHRYTLWAKQLELALGGPSAHLARLGSSYLQEENE